MNISKYPLDKKLSFIYILTNHGNLQMFQMRKKNNPFYFAEEISMF